MMPAAMYQFFYKPVLQLMVQGNKYSGEYNKNQYFQQRVVIGKVRDRRVQRRGKGFKKKKGTTGGAGLFASKPNICISDSKKKLFPDFKT